MLMINLHSFGSNLGVMDPSPFVVKVDAFLKMTKLPYQVISGTHNMKKAPKGKLPFISVPGQGEELLIADSQQIFVYLTQNYSVNLDGFLTKEQQAQAYLFTKSLDENLYWCLVYSRWVDDNTWPFVKKAFFGKMSAPLCWAVVKRLKSHLTFLNSVYYLDRQALEKQLK